MHDIFLFVYILFVCVYFSLFSRVELIYEYVSEHILVCAMMFLRKFEITCMFRDRL